MHEKTIKTKRIYKGRIISIREDIVKLSNGVISKREIMEHPGAVVVVPITKDGQVVMIRQFRKTAEKILYEIPAGLVHKGEKWIDGAKRELTEETGLKAKKIKELFWGYSSPGISTEIMRFYIATELEESEQNCDHDEMIEVLIVPLKKALSMIKTGKIIDVKTIVGILAAANNIWKTK